MGDSRTRFAATQTLDPGSAWPTQGGTAPGSLALTFNLQSWHGPTADLDRWELWEGAVPVTPTVCTVFGGQIILQNGVSATPDRVRYTTAVPPFRFYPNNSLASFDFSGPWV